MKKHYAERDLLEMDCAGNFYGNHVMAMTAEQLHSKSDIAAELGWRDMQIAALQRKVEDTEALMQAMRDDSRESRSKLELMVAENAALKESRKRLGEFILEEIDADYPLNMDLKTTATDAMVNEIRAEGVELAINHLMNKFEGTGHIGVPVMALESLANQLRADAAKGGE